MDSSGPEGSRRAAKGSGIRMAVLGQGKWYKEFASVSRSMQDTLTHCFIFLLPCTGIICPMPQWVQRGKGTFPRLHSELMAESAKVFTPRQCPSSFCQEMGSRKVILEGG